MPKSYDIHVTLNLSHEASQALYRIMRQRGDLDLSRTLSDAVILQDYIQRALEEGHEVLCRASDGREVPVVEPDIMAAPLSRH